MREKERQRGGEKEMGGDRQSIKYIHVAITDDLYQVIHYTMTEPSNEGQTTVSRFARLTHIMCVHMQE